jgi:hypothetical protein
MIRWSSRAALGPDGRLGDRSVRTIIDRFGEAPLLTGGWRRKRLKRSTRPGGVRMFEPQDLLPDCHGSLIERSCGRQLAHPDQRLPEA